MRIRSIKPEFWTSQDIADLPWEDRLLFIGVWSYVDDNGVGRDVPKLIAADLFPLEDDPRETLATVSRGLQTLADRGLIERYMVDDRPYLHVAAWDSHQRIDRPSKARYPLPTCKDAVPTTYCDGASRQSRDSLDAGAGEQGSRGAGEQESAAAQAPPKKPPAKPLNTATPEARIANAVYDHTQGMDKWEASQSIAKRALKVKGATEGSVQAAMTAIYDAGKPITVTTVGQVLSGALSLNGQQINGKRHQSDGYHNGVALAKRLYDEEQEEEQAQLALEGNHP